MFYKRGKSNWVKSQIAGAPPAVPTEFESLAGSLQLDQKRYVDSQQLRHWCELNKNRRYVPEWLLKEWNMRVESDRFESR